LSRNRQWLVLALLLIILGSLILAYKHVRLGFPLLPDLQSEAWSIQARVHLEPRSGPVRASLILPSRPTGFTVSEENFISRGFGLTLEEDAFWRQANWAIRRMRGPTTLYYRATVIRDTRARSFAPRPEYPPVPELEEPFATALKDIITEVRAQSADIESFAAAMMARMTGQQNDEDTRLFLSSVESPLDRVRVVQTLLAGARIPTLQVHGVRFDQDQQAAPISTLLAVHDGDDWLVFDPFTGDEGLPDSFFIWWTGDREMTGVRGASIGEAQISTRKQLKSALDLATQRVRIRESRVGLISILQLPLQTQTVYEVLLLIPFGILVIVLLRNFVGLSSFGTFAPVLIALAFRETELLKGILLFILIVSLGLGFRFYLERLRLLLVPRLAAVVTIVVLLMTAISIISNEMGIETGLSVSLFPMIIISLVIERMSIVWEERGAGTALKEGAGSLLMASLAYLVMGIDELRYWVTVFPECNFIVLGLIVAMGRYTGFRLTELFRFSRINEGQPTS
jgi:hypothetical protein